MIITKNHGYNKLLCLGMATQHDCMGQLGQNERLLICYIKSGMIQNVILAVILLPAGQWLLPWVNDLILTESVALLPFYLPENGWGKVVSVNCFGSSPRLLKSVCIQRYGVKYTSITLVHDGLCNWLCNQNWWCFWIECCVLLWQPNPTHMVHSTTVVNLHKPSVCNIRLLPTPQPNEGDKENDYYNSTFYTE